MLPPASRAPGINWFYTLFYLGLAVLPPFVGRAGEAIGSMLGPFRAATASAAVSASKAVVALRMRQLR